MVAMLKVTCQIKNPSINWCVCTWRKFLPNFTAIQFETMKP